MMTTSSAVRSPDPRYQQTKSSPSGRRRMLEAWLCFASSGKMSSFSTKGFSASAAVTINRVVIRKRNMAGLAVIVQQSDPLKWGIDAESTARAVRREPVRVRDPLLDEAFAGPRARRLFHV